MTGRFGSTTIVLAALVFAVTAHAAGDDDGRYRYTKRLSLPIATDAFRQPTAVHADPHGRETFVVDAFQNRIVIFDEEGLYRYTIPGGSTFRAPRDIAVDPEGYLFLVARVEGRLVLLVLDFDGRFVDELRLTGLPSDALEPEPVSIALSTAGDRIYLVDQSNLTLWISDRAGKVVGSADLAGQMDEKGRMELMLGHVDVYGKTVLVASPTEGRVWLFDLDGTPLGGVGIKGAGPRQTALPMAAALDANGDVLVVDQQRSIVTRWRRSDNHCIAEFSGFGTVPGALYRPIDMSLDFAGRISVSQGYQGRVQMFEGGPPAAGRRGGAR